MTSPGIFAEYGAQLSELGYSVFPCEGKAVKITNWNQYRDYAPTQDQIDGWCYHSPNHNVGLPMGAFNGFVALDIDFRDLWKIPVNRPLCKEWAFEILKLCPRTPFIRTGFKPWAALYKYNGQAGGAINVKGISVGELITQGQLIMPPSIHPDTLKPYRWIGGHKLEDYDKEQAADAVPIFSDADLILLSQKLEHIIDPSLIPAKPVAKKTQTHEEGRNRGLALMAWAIYHKGKTVEECAAELLEWDYKLHSDNPLFADPTDNYRMCKTPETAALKMARQVHRNFETKKKQGLIK